MAHQFADVVDVYVGHDVAYIGGRQLPGMLERTPVDGIEIVGAALLWYCAGRKTAFQAATLYDNHGELEITQGQQFIEIVTGEGYEHGAHEIVSIVESDGFGEVVLGLREVAT